MNSRIAASSIYWPRSPSTYTVLQPISEGSLPSDPSYKLSSSWKMFAAMSTQQPGAEAITADIIIPTERTIAAGPTILKPKPLPEDYDARVESFLRFLDSLDVDVEMTDDTTIGQ